MTLVLSFCHKKGSKAATVMEINTSALLVVSDTHIKYDIFYEIT